MIGAMMFERSLFTPAALYKKVTLGGEMGEPRTLGVLPTELLEILIRSSRGGDDGDNQIGEPGTLGVLTAEFLGTMINQCLCRN